MRSWISFRNHRNRRTWRRFFFPIEAFRTVGAVCEAVKEMGAGTEIAKRMVQMRQLRFDFGASPHFFHSFTDRAYSADALRAKSLRPVRELRSVEEVYFDRHMPAALCGSRVHCRQEQMEAAGIEPASENDRSERLHACQIPICYVPA